MARGTSPHAQAADAKGLGAPGGHQGPPPAVPVGQRSRKWPERRPAFAAAAAGLTRAALLRGTLAATAALSAGAVLTACAGAAAAPSAARPQALAATTTLKFAPWGQWPNIGKDWQQFIRPPLDGFERAHPGLRIQVVPPVSGGAALPQLLAGSAPDVFSEYDIVPYLQRPGLLANLAPLLKKDNLSTDIWSQGQRSYFSTPSGLWFLPTYLNVATMAVNLGDLDELGLAYPAPDWTSAEAARLFQATTHDKGGQHRYGFSPVFRGRPFPSAGPLPNALYALEIFGGTAIDATRTRCTLDDPRVVRAAEWWLQLFQSGVATDVHSPLAVPWRATFVENRNNHLLFDAQHWTRNYKWAFLPIPRYPAGPMSWVGSEGYAINAATKSPEAAWTFLKFLVVQPEWQRYSMKTILEPPSILALWPQMTTVMEQMVPGFRGKGLHWYAESAAKWGRAVPAFAYNPVAAMNVINTAFADILAGAVDVAGALRAATRQVNAIQAQGPAMAAAASRASAAFPVVGPATAAVPPGL